MRKAITSLLGFFVVANLAWTALFAQDALSSVKAAQVNPNAVFDGSKSMSAKTPSISQATKSASAPSVKEETPKPSLGEKIKEIIKKNKGNLIVSGAAAFAGYFLFGGPVGALISFGMMFLFLAFLRL